MKDYYNIKDLVDKSINIIMELQARLDMMEMYDNGAGGPGACTPVLYTDFPTKVRGLGWTLPPFPFTITWRRKNLRNGLSSI